MNPFEKHLKVRACRICGRWTDLELLGVDDVCPRCSGKVFGISILSWFFVALPWIVGAALMGIILYITGCNL